jgi:hypothetical protein
MTFQQKRFKQDVLHYCLWSINSLISFEIRKNCFFSKRSLLLYQYTRWEIKLIVAIIRRLHCCQLHTILPTNSPVSTKKITIRSKERGAKHAKESEHWLNQISTSNCYTPLLEEGSQDQQQKAGPENTPKPQFCITDVKNSNSMKQQYEVKALAHNQFEVQPKYLSLIEQL